MSNTKIVKTLDKSHRSSQHIRNTKEVAAAPKSAESRDYLFRLVRQPM